MNFLIRKAKLVFLTVIVLSLSVFAQQKFVINLNDRTNDTFKVTVYPKDLSSENNIFQFASTAPGTYQIMNIGRFVKNFNAFNDNGDSLEVEKISTNQYKIKDPEDVYKITYTISDTWDTPVQEHPVYPMAGTSIEEDHALINGQAVFGYFWGKQSDQIFVKLEYPSNWTIGTALHTNSDGYYVAESYDYIVDSPILMGKLTKATTKIEDTDVNIYTYSKTGLIKSTDLLNVISDILDAESKFINGLPVKHYEFLFHFEDVTVGAWEHSYSSEYVYKEAPLTKPVIDGIKRVAAHEFFHIVTPLNIHSELVENFNFVKPVLSQHLWLYEGVTEWAANIIQLRDSLMSLDGYLKTTSQKLITNDFFDQSISLTELGLKATELPQQYGNIYMKGAVIPTLLDIRLLELSKGKFGLRELLKELTNKYGKHKSFSEANFFNEIVDMTYPEIRDFINKYIKGAEPLPTKEYFKKIGIDYFSVKGVDSSKASLGVQIGVKGQKLIIAKSHKSDQTGLLEGDIIEEVEGIKVTLQNANQAFAKFAKLKVGDSMNFTLTRENKLVKVTSKISARENKHVFEVNPNATEEQLKLRKVWMKNL